MNVLSNWPIKKQLIALISLCLFLQIILSYPLWHGQSRFYPLIPVIESLPFQWFSTFQMLFILVILSSLLLFIFGYQKKSFFYIFLFALILLILEDINRLQVWIYHLGIFMTLLFFTKEKKEAELLVALKIGIIGIYWWSGLQKLNIYFIEDIFPWMMEPFGLSGFIENYPNLAIIAALLESLLGIGLLFRKSRRATVIIAIGFHVLILIALGPLGHNWNQVVWPWNICMIGLLLLLFYESHDPVFAGLKMTTLKSPLLPVVLLFVLFPGLNFLGYWDEQLSFKMYSGHSPEGVIYFKRQDENCITKESIKEIIHFEYSTQTNRVILDDWAFAELKVAPYKSRYRIMQAAKKLCDCLEKSELAGLEILEVQRWNKANDEFVRIPCQELTGKTNNGLSDYFNK